MCLRRVTLSDRCQSLPRRDRPEFTPRHWVDPVGQSCGPGQCHDGINQGKNCKSAADHGKLVLDLRSSPLPSFLGPLFVCFFLSCFPSAIFEAICSVDTTTTTTTNTTTTATTTLALYLSDPPSVESPSSPCLCSLVFCRSPCARWKSSAARYVLDTCRVAPSSTNVQ